MNDNSTRARIMKELAVALVFVALLVFAVNPLGLWMPNSITMMAAGLLVVLFGVFAAYIWQEGKGDEREMFHRYLASRVAYLASAGILVIGVTVQIFQHNVDPWLAAALAVTILAKAASLVYAQLAK